MDCPPTVDMNTTQTCTLLTAFDTSDNYTIEISYGDGFKSSMSIQDGETKITYTRYVLKAKYTMIVKIPLNNTSTNSTFSVNPGILIFTKSMNYCKSRAVQLK